VTFIIVASLRALSHDIRKVFDDLLSMNGKKICYQYCDMWMMKIIIDAIMRSFEIWIKPVKVEVDVSIKRNYC
jgi:hypothetical protein